MTSVVFAMQDFGILVGATVAIILSAGFKRTYMDDHLGSIVPEADFVWRTILMLGAIPAALTYFWRMKMPKTARYTALIEKDEKRAAADMSRFLDIDMGEPPINVKLFRRNESRFGLFSREFIRRHGLHLLGTTSTWFLFDVAFYSQMLFQKDIFSAMGWLPAAKKMNAVKEVYKIARAQSIIALCSAVPGYWVTVLLIDCIGRKKIQLMGFFLMTVFMFALAIPYYHWRGKVCPRGFCDGNHPAFLILYALTFFFSNFGPNSNIVAKYLPLKKSFKWKSSRDQKFQGKE